MDPKTKSFLQNVFLYNTGLTPTFTLSLSRTFDRFEDVSEDRMPLGNPCHAKDVTVF
jgi:hypothetical protein